MFPYSQDAPFLLFQCLGDTLITHSVGSQLFPPKACIIFWPSLVDGATVPKASVNKYGHTMSAKNEVRVSNKMLVASPTLNTEFFEYSD
jgi:hypothetical protein